MGRLKILFIILLLVSTAGVFIANFRAKTQAVTSNTGAQEGQQTGSPENKDAKAYYEEGVKQYAISEPYDPINHEQRKGERFERAIESFKRAISLKPDYAEAYNYLGTSYNSLHQYELALEAYKNAARLKPDWVEPHYMIGKTYASLHRYDEALEVHENAAQLIPDSYEPYVGMGQVYTSLQRYDEAINAYMKALDLFSKAFGGPHPGIIQSMAMVYLKSGDRQAAMKQYRVLKKVCEKRDCRGMVEELRYLLNEK